MSHRSDTNRRYRAAIVLLAPSVLLAGCLYHPWIGNPGDADFLARLAAAVTAEPGRWAVAHLAIAVGSGLLVLAFLAVRAHLREAGGEPWSALAIPFVVMGSTLYALLPAMEFAPLAAARSGGDVAAAQAAIQPWFVPVLLTGAALFALGTIGFAVGLARSQALGRNATGLAVGALLVMAAARFFPVGAAQLYIGPAAGVLALWPLAPALAKRAEAGPNSATASLPATA